MLPLLPCGLGLLEVLVRVVVELELLVCRFFVELFGGLLLWLEVDLLRAVLDGPAREHHVGCRALLGLLLLECLQLSQPLLLCELLLHESLLLLRLGLLLDEDVDRDEVRVLRGVPVEVSCQVLLLLHQVVEAALDLAQCHHDVVVWVIVDAEEPQRLGGRLEQLVHLLGRGTRVCSLDQRPEPRASLLRLLRRQPSGRVAVSSLQRSIGGARVLARAVRSATLVSLATVPLLDLREVVVAGLGDLQVRFKVLNVAVHCLELVLHHRLLLL